MGREKRLSTAQARKLLNEILASAGQSPLHAASVAEFLRQWVASKGVARAAGTAAKYAQTINEFVAFLGDKADGPLDGVIATDVERWRDAQRREGRQASTVNVKLKALRAAFNDARRKQFVLANPFEAVDFLKSRQAERRPFTMEEVKALLAAADEEWRGMILLSAFAGLREGDAARLTWENLDLKTAVIRYRQQKSDKVLQVPMHPDVAAYFRQLPRSIRDGAPVFSTLSKLSTGGCNGISARFKKCVMRKAGISDEKETREDTGKGRNRSQLSFHSLRHTFVSEMANGRVSEEMRKKLAGHTSNASQIYTHFHIDSLREAVNQIPRVTGDDGLRARRAV